MEKKPDQSEWLCYSPEISWLNRAGGSGRAARAIALPPSSSPAKCSHHTYAVMQAFAHKIPHIVTRTVYTCNNRGHGVGRCSVEQFFNKFLL